MLVQSLALLSGLRIWRSRELWCRSQMRLRSGVAVAVMYAGSYSSDWTPSPEGPKKTKNKKPSLPQHLPLKYDRLHCAK